MTRTCNKNYGLKVGQTRNEQRPRQRKKFLEQEEDQGGGFGSSGGGFSSSSSLPHDSVPLQALELQEKLPLAARLDRRLGGNFSCNGFQPSQDDKIGQSGSGGCCWFGCEAGGVGMGLVMEFVCVRRNLHKQRQLPARAHHNHYHHHHHHNCNHDCMRKKSSIILTCDQLDGPPSLHRHPAKNPAVDLDAEAPLSECIIQPSLPLPLHTCGNTTTTKLRLSQCIPMNTHNHKQQPAGSNSLLNLSSLSHHHYHHHHHHAPSQHPPPSLLPVVGCSKETTTTKLPYCAPRLPEATASPTCLVASRRPIFPAVNHDNSNKQNEARQKNHPAQLAASQAIILILLLLWLLLLLLFVAPHQSRQLSGLPRGLPVGTSEAGPACKWPLAATATSTDTRAAAHTDTSSNAGLRPLFYNYYTQALRRSSSCRPRCLQLHQMAKKICCDPAPPPPSSAVISDNQYCQILSKYPQPPFPHLAQRNKITGPGCSHTSITGELMASSLLLLSGSYDENYRTAKNAPDGLEKIPYMSHSATSGPPERELTSLASCCCRRCRPQNSLTPLAYPDLKILTNPPAAPSFVARENPLASPSRPPCPDNKNNSSSLVMLAHSNLVLASSLRLSWPLGSRFLTPTASARLIEEFSVVVSRDDESLRHFTGNQRPAKQKEGLLSKQEACGRTTTPRVACLVQTSKRLLACHSVQPWLCCFMGPVFGGPTGRRPKQFEKIVRPEELNDFRDERGRDEYWFPAAHSNTVVVVVGPKRDGGGHGERLCFGGAESAAVRLFMSRLEPVRDQQPGATSNDNHLAAGHQPLLTTTTTTMDNIESRTGAREDPPAVGGGGPVTSKRKLLGSDMGEFEWICCGHGAFVQQQQQQQSCGGSRSGCGCGTQVASNNNNKDSQCCPLKLPQNHHPNGFTQIGKSPQSWAPPGCCLDDDNNYDQKEKFPSTAAAVQHKTIHGRYMATSRISKSTKAAMASSFYNPNFAHWPRLEASMGGGKMAKNNEDGDMEVAEVHGKVSVTTGGSRKRQRYDEMNLLSPAQAHSQKPQQQRDCDTKMMMNCPSGRYEFRRRLNDDKMSGTLETVVDKCRYKVPAVDGSRERLGIWQASDGIVHTSPEVKYGGQAESIEKPNGGPESGRRRRRRLSIDGGNGDGIVLPRPLDKHIGGAHFPAGLLSHLVHMYGLCLGFLGALINHNSGRMALLAEAAVTGQPSQPMDMANYSKFLGAAAAVVVVVADVDVDGVGGPENLFGLHGSGADLLGYYQNNPPPELKPHKQQQQAEQVGTMNASAGNVQYDAVMQSITNGSPPLVKDDNLNNRKTIGPAAKSIDYNSAMSLKQHPKQQQHQQTNWPLPCSSSSSSSSSSSELNHLEERKKASSNLWPHSTSTMAQGSRAKDLWALSQPEVAGKRLLFPPNLYTEHQETVGRWSLANLGSRGLPGDSDSMVADERVERRTRRAKRWPSSHFLLMPPPPPPPQQTQNIKLEGNPRALKMPQPPPSGLAADDKLLTSHDDVATTTNQLNELLEGGSSFGLPRPGADESIASSPERKQEREQEEEEEASVQFTSNEQEATITKTRYPKMLASCFIEQQLPKSSGNEQTILDNLGHNCPDAGDGDREIWRKYCSVTFTSQLLSAGRDTNVGQLPGAGELRNSIPGSGSGFGHSEEAQEAAQEPRAVCCCRPGPASATLEDTIDYWLTIQQTENNDNQLVGPNHHYYSHHHHHHHHHSTSENSTEPPSESQVYRGDSTAAARELPTTTTTTTEFLLGRWDLGRGASSATAAASSKKTKLVVNLSPQPEEQINSISSEAKVFTLNHIVAEAASDSSHSSDTENIVNPNLRDQLEAVHLSSPSSLSQAAPLPIIIPTLIVNNKLRPPQHSIEETVGSAAAASNLISSSSSSSNLISNNSSLIAANETTNINYYQRDHQQSPSILATSINIHHHLLPIDDHDSDEGFTLAAASPSLSSSPISSSSSLSTTATTSRDMIEKSGGHFALPIALILGLIITITFVGNVLVCLSVIRVRKLRHPSNYLLISLAISDLCVACVVMPFGLYQSINDKWQLGRLLCNVYVVSDVTSCTASILNLCVISIDRYLAITRPLTYCVKRTTRLMMILIAFVWICACLISVPPLLISGNEYGTQEEPRCEVSQSLWYQLYATCISFYIPLIVMICLYYNIYTAAKRVVEAEQRATTGLHINSNNNNNSSSGGANKKDSQVNIAIEPCNINNNNTNISRGNRGGTVMLNNNNNINTTNTNNNSSSPSHETPTSTPKSSSRTSSVMRERKASITLGVIMSAFTICWLPFFIIALLRPFSESVNNLPRTFVLLTLWLGYANSLLNPIIYVTFHHDFRNAFKHLLCLRCMTINEHIRKDEYKSQYGETHYQENIRKMRSQQQQQLLSKKVNQLP